MNKRNKQERLSIVIELCKKLTTFPKSTTSIGDTNPYINLYTSDFPAIKKLKNVFQDFINQDETNSKYLTGMSGNISFPEMDRRIEYILPINKKSEPVLILRTTLNTKKSK